MKAKLSKGPNPFWIPYPREKFNPTQALADLARKNSLEAVDIVQRAVEGESEVFVEMVESVGLDAVNISIEMGQLADHRNQNMIRDLQARIESYNQRGRKEAEPTFTEAEVKPRGKRRESFHGKPITAVIRWMGDDGWTFEQAKTALRSLKITSIADGTIRTQLRAGVRGLKPPASLTESEIDSLYDAVDSA